MSPSTAPARKPGRICIVDDTAIHVALLRAILEPRGHTIIPMTSAEEALPEVLEQPPHVLMVDIKMPDMDGFTFVETLKERGLSSETRIIFMTSGLEPDNEQRARDLGASDFLVKPFDSEDTIRRVEALVSAPRKPVTHSQAGAQEHHQLLSMLEGAWRLSLPDEVLAGRPVSEFTADDPLTMATASVAGKARNRGIELHVEALPSIALRGDRELVALVWAQMLDAAIVRAEPGTAVTVTLSPSAAGVQLRVGLTCAAPTAAHMIKMSGTGSPLKVERVGERRVDIVADISRSG